MNNQHIIEKIYAKQTLIPIIISSHEEDIINFIKILYTNNIRTVELSVNNNNIFSIIKKIAFLYPNLIIGVCHIQTTDQYHKAVSHHASYLVSYGTTSDLYIVAEEYDNPFFPAVYTPSEILTATDHGYNNLRFCPITDRIDLAMLEDYSNAFLETKFTPQGRFNAHHALQFASLSNINLICSSYWSNVHLNDATKIVQINNAIKLITNN